MRAKAEKGRLRGSAAERAESPGRSARRREKPLIILKFCDFC